MEVKFSGDSGSVRDGWVNGWGGSGPYRQLDGSITTCQMAVLMRRAKSEN